MSDTSAPAYRRILLKLSGEALRSPGSMDNISPEIVARIAEEIAQAHRAGVQIGLVVGGGNFWRGAKASVRGMDRATADYVGMHATVRDGALIGSGCFSAAGAGVLSGMEVPPNSLVAGVPGKILRRDDPHSLERTRDNCQEYILLAEGHAGREALT